MKKFVFVVSLTTGLMACSVPPLQFVPPNVTASQRKLDAALISTVVTVASKPEAKGKIDIAGAEADITSLWKSALEDSLLRTAVFRDNAKRRFTLAVKIVKLSQGGYIGTEFNAGAIYQLVDRDTGQVVFSKEIYTDGRASDYVGDNRVRNAASRSVQANILAFLRELETLDLRSAP